MKTSPRSPYFRLLAGLSLFLIAQSPLMVSAGWNLVWSDEFNLAAGTSPDASKWGYDIGGGGWGNGELQYYTDRPQNVSHDGNGNLVITVLNEPDYLESGRNYTSARILTKGIVDWAYGRFEARIQVPTGGAGLWPAFWMLGNDIGSVGWPQCGEIDIMEYVSKWPDTVTAALHGPGYSGGNPWATNYDIGEPVVNNYHIFAVEWSPNLIRWFFDGFEYHNAVPSDLTGPWVFDHNFFLILNVAVGGSFGGPLDLPNLTFPTEMLVDYVRVYESDGIPDSIDIPAIVQMEDYTTQSGAIFQATTDTGGGYNAGFLSDGDYIEFLLNSPSAATYSIDMRVASGTTLTGSVTVTADGNSVTSGAITDTGGWQTWTTVPVGEIFLPAGLVTLRVTINSPGPGQDVMNINWMDVSLSGTTGPQLTLTKTGTFNDENEDGFAQPGETISYTFTIENTGDVPLTNITVTDPLVTVIGTPSGPTNLLTNGGFDTAIGAEWTQNLSGGSAANSTLYARTGTNSLLIDSTGAAGEWASPNLSQTFTASPGEEFNLQGWMLAPAGGIPGASFGLLKIEFTDGGGTALDPASVSIGGSAAAPYFGAESTPFLNGGSATETWIFTETQAVAPAGTAFVRFVVLNVNQPGNPGPMYYDDILATDVAAGGGTVNLLVGQTDNTTFTGTYTITEADINAGKVVNTATADSDESAPDNDVEITLVEANPTVDTDEDSFLNIFERAYGLDIFNPDPLSDGPAGSLTEVTSQDYVSLTYRRLSDGSGTTGVSYTADGYNYVVEVSSNLNPGSWQSGGAYVEAVGSPVDNGDGTETVTVRALAPMIPGSKVFIRLNVTKTP